MTMTQDPPHTRAESREPVVPAQRSVPGGRIAVVVAVVLIAGFAWYLAARQSAHALDVTYGHLECTVGHVHRVPVTPEDGDRVTAPSLPVQPGQRCVLPVTVTNRGLASVRLTAAGLPALGPGTDQAIHVRSVGRSRPEGEHGHGWVALDHRLAPGASTTLRLELRYRAGGCTDGHQVTLTDLPTLNTTAWGLRQTVHPGLTLVLRGSAATACRD